MTSKAERIKQFGANQRSALLAAIRNHDQRQLRERAATLARHGNDDHQIAVEQGISTEIVRRWLGEAAGR
jgi:hypothetical protein